MIKSVKLAMENGEGCRVSFFSSSISHFTNDISAVVFKYILVFLTSLWLQTLQVYGALDVQRVAGNFHISVHGLNIFVANQVIHLKLQIL